MTAADERIHGTTHEQPSVRFARDERSALRPLPSPVLPVREQRVRRRDATDCFVDVATIRYSVPHRLVGSNVDVLVGEHEVVVFDGAVAVARHRRHANHIQRVIDPRHFEGIYRQRDDAEDLGSSPIGRSLDVYADAIGGAA